MQLGELRAVARFPVYLGVAQLVACYLGVVEAAGSSPVTQTRENPRSFEDFSGLRGVFAFREIECSEHYSGTIFSKKRKSQQKPSTEFPLTVSFCLFLYGAASCSINIHVLFSSHSQAHFPAFGISYKFSDLFLSHPPIFLTRL